MISEDLQGNPRWQCDPFNNSCNIMGIMKQLSQRQKDFQVKIGSITVIFGICFTHWFAHWLFKLLLVFFSFTESLKPYFTHKPKNITAKLHSSTTVVKCSAKGIPKPTVKWVRYTGSGETVIRSGGRFIVFGNLYIFHLQWSDSGKYGCVAQNKYGRAEAHFYITVRTGM